MPKASFRLHSVAIEGFKGFTDIQKIEFSEKHMFLFGRNSCGKSSVVEAIRWCLFGLAERPDTEVRNVYYDPSECQVSMELKSSDGIWKVQRQLRPGAERSRLTITNPAGREVLLSQVFPYLARMGPRECTHVIFAAQHSLRRRPQADISDFHKVLYSYLHLERVDDLLEKLEKLIEEQQSVREEVASDLNDIEEGLRQKLNQVHLSLEELLRNPPWLEGSTPTRADTKAKVHSFAKEMAELAGSSLAQDTSAQEALEQAEQWAHELSNATQQELEEKSDELQSKLTALENLLNSLRQAEKSRTEAEVSIKQLKEKLIDACEGESLEEFEARLGKLDIQLKESNAKLAIGETLENIARNAPRANARCV